MAENVYTATYFLESLKRRGLLPSSAQTFQTEGYLALADEELQTDVVALLRSVQEEFLVVSKDIDIVSGTDSYDIPERASGGSLRDVKVDTGTDAFVPLQRIEPERIHDYYNTSGTPECYSLQGNKIVIHPEPSAAGTLRVTYYRRPSRLVSVSACGKVTAVAGAAITVNAAPASFTSSETYDIVSGTPGFESLGDDLTVASVVGNVVTFSTAPSDVAVGDYVCLAGESPIPQVPVECHPYLAQRVVVRALEALGDAKAKVAKATADEMQKKVMSLLTPRVEGSPRVIINRNAPGFGRFVRRWR